MDPARTIGGGVRAIVPIAEGACLAIGSNGGLFRLGASGGFHPWGPNVSRYAFYGIVPNGESITLVGGSTDWGRGMIARLVGESLTIVAEELGVRTLYAAAHLDDGSTIAVGAAGGIARLRGGAVVESMNPCQLDLLVTGKAGADLLVAGAGAWAFRVTSAPLTATVEPVETQSDLRCLAVDETGNAWLGTSTGRILRRREKHWRRYSPSYRGEPAVLAIHASSHRVRAVLADGSIVLGQALTPEPPGKQVT